MAIGAKDFIPDLRTITSFSTSRYAPLFGEAKATLDRISPKDLVPSYMRPSTLKNLAPDMSRVGLNFSPSKYLPNDFTPGFTPPTNFMPHLPGMGLDLGGFGLPTSPATTLDDLLRKFGKGPYMPAPPSPGQPGYGGEGVGAAPNDAAILNQYDPFFQEASSKYGVPVNMIKAIAWTERGWEGTSGQGAAGLMQIMPNIWGGKARELGYGGFATDPRQAILMGAWILNENRKQYGSWELAARAYLGFGTDALGTDDSEYWASVKEKWDYLNQSGGTVGGGSYTGGGTGLPSVFGGQSFGISQGIGGHAMDYGYGVGLGVGNSHPGIDIAAPRGTKAYFPGMGQVTGTVVTAGGSGYFCDDYGCGPGHGELRIQLSNGDILIYGHMGNIAVQPGQVIVPGTFLGTTGQAGSGAHLHLEYRKRSNACGDGYCAIDPRNVIGF
jgi:murein DD-endopeptidase MepM/ murein hydrolase activator NlpD